MTTETIEQLSLFEVPVTKPANPRPNIEELRERSKSAKKINPCLALYGAGPDGAKCKTCVHLRGAQYSKVYWKCDLREITHSSATDQKVNWPACGKYEQGEHPDKVVFMPH